MGKIIEAQALLDLSELPTAKDMKKETDAVHISINSNTISEITKEIFEASAKGEYYILYSGVLDKAIINALEAKGYSMKYSCAMNESETKISWEEA